MKIEQIINEIYSTYVRERPVGRREAIRRLKDREQNVIKSPNALGSGYFSKVYNNSRDPHTVKKLASRRTSFDNFNLYAEWIVSNPEAKANIHFPRIYGITKNKVVNGPLYSGNRDKNFYQDYEIEKLVEDPPEHQLLAVFETYVKSFDNNFVNIDDIREREDDLKLVLIGGIEDVLYGTNYSGIKLNESLENAAILLKELVNKLTSEGHRFTLDLHLGNIMFRVGAHAPIPVITDPFS